MARTLTLLMFLSFFIQSGHGQTIGTGWYHISDTPTSHYRILDKTNDSFFIVPEPILEASNFHMIYFYLMLDDAGYNVLKLDIMLDGPGYTYLQKVVSQTQSRVIGLLVNNKLIDTLHTNKLIPLGNHFGIQRNIYSVSQLKTLFDNIHSAMLPKYQATSSRDDLQELLEKVDKTNNHVIY